MKNNTTVNRNRKRRKSRMAVSQSAANKNMDKRSKSERKMNKNARIANIIMKLMISVVLVIIAVVFIFCSGAFNISKIIVEGNSSVSEEQIISFSGVQMGTNLFAISKNDIINNIKENSYVNNVNIKRILPNQLKFIIEERKLEYVLQLANSYLYVDKQGFILEISNERPEVPIILGLATDLSNLKPNNRLEDADLKKMDLMAKIMNVAKANEMSNLITKIDVSDENDYIVHFDTEGKIAYVGNGDELNTRFLYIKSLIEKNEGKKGEIFVDVDLNKEYVYFRESV